MTEDVMAGADRRAALEAAEVKALAMFDAIEAAGLIAPGRTESEVARDIFALAEARFGVVQHWHRQIVRAGANALTTAADYPDERTIAADDAVYVDLGPVFEAWEADIGRTYAIGDDPEKHRLAADLPRVFERVQQHYRASPDITGAELYAFAQPRPTRPAGPSAAPSPATGSASSRTAAGPASATSRRSGRPTPLRCARTTTSAASAAGSSRSTSSTAPGPSAAFTNGCFERAGAQMSVRACQQAALFSSCSCRLTDSRYYSRRLGDSPIQAV